ncbi:MAG: hypothetical protein IKJ34_01520 [Mailhella sp.]|nr:hypothetical protein [Mailhella sp.]
MPNREPYIEKTKKTPQKRVGSGAREVALGVLHQLFQHPDDGTPLPLLLMKASQSAELGARDIALVSELVFGVLRRSALLDILLADFLKRPGALSPQVRILLKVGVYEILFMDGIPSRATVSELVELGRRRFGQGLGGLVNGVLRSVDREAERLHAKVEQSPPAEAASIPAWLMTMWSAQYGAERAASFASNTLSHAAPCWRVNMARENAETLRASWLERGFAPVGQHGFTSAGLDKARAGAKDEQDALAELEASGAVSRQGISSQLVAEMIAQRILGDASLAKAELWDACCGRGGKTAALLEKGVHVTLASDPTPFRVEELQSSVRRLALPVPNVKCAVEQDVDVHYPLILLDVPCSGTGTLGRVPELRLRLTPDKLNEAERLQGVILEDAWSKLRPGGLLFYVTCALNRKENEGRIEKFLRMHGTENGGDAFLEEQRLFLPELPGHDALFLAVLEKR